MLSKTGVSLDEVRHMNEPASTFLCEVGANHYALQFLNHSIEDHDSGEVFFTFRYSSSLRQQSYKPRLLLFFPNNFKSKSCFKRLFQFAPRECNSSWATGDHQPNEDHFLCASLPNAGFQRELDGTNPVQSGQQTGEQSCNDRKTLLQGKQNQGIRVQVRQSLKPARTTATPKASTSGTTSTRYPNWTRGFWRIIRESTPRTFALTRTFSSTAKWSSTTSPIIFTMTLSLQLPKINKTVFI